jgi:hypothetical protein
MRPSQLHVLAFIIGISALVGRPLAAQRALTFGIGAGKAFGHARATDHSGLQLMVAAERALNRPSSIAVRVDGMLVDWRVGYPAALSANIVLYAAPATRLSPYVLAGIGVYGLGDNALGGGNVGAGLRYPLTQTTLFAEGRVHVLHGGVTGIPSLTIGLRF